MDKANPHPPPPNFVIILADDLGACDLGCYGNADAETPHLDQLASVSLRHEAFYVTPVCAPTRAALLTGRHHLRTGVAGVHGGKDHIHLSETLLPQWLKPAGYVSGIWGKWHSGMSEGYLPHQRGFDETLLLNLYRHRSPAGCRNGEDPVVFTDRWADDVIVEHALDFMRRNADRPFLAFISSMTPHAPLDAPEAEIERLMREKGLSRNLATLHAQVSRFDQAVGRLRRGLDSLNTRGRETILIFLSDNGPAMLEDSFTDHERSRRNVLSWRGWKGDVWEAGIRTPLFIHRIGEPGGAVVSQPSDVTDLLPTLLAWAGIPVGTDRLPLDGRDLAPMLRGETLPLKPIPSWVHPAIPPAPNRGEARKHQMEYQPLTPPEKAALDPAEQVMGLWVGNWKLTQNADLNKAGGPHPSIFLGDLVENPHEARDLSREKPGISREMQFQLREWFLEMRGGTLKAGTAGALERQSRPHP